MDITHRQVGFIAAEGGLSRAGEGAFLRLCDGSIMLAYTEYDTADFGDDASAYLAAVCSHDEGETWGGHRVLLRKNEGDLNVMSVSFLRLPNEEILLFYLKKSRKEGLVLCQPFVRRSADEGQSWSDEICCGPRDRYYVVNNDRVVQLKNGRILMPAAVYAPPLFGTPLSCAAAVCMIVSEDNGLSWRETEEIRLPVPHRTGPEEPGLYEHEDGTVWCYMRTQLGCQWQMFSHDGGDTWSTPCPNMFFTSPNSPMLVKKVCGLTAAVFNPIPNYNTRKKTLWGRTPFVLAVSETDGAGYNAEAFPRVYTIENDPNNNYCYPAMLEGEGYFLMAYYHSNGSNCPLNSMKVVKFDVNMD